MMAEQKVAQLTSPREHIKTTTTYRTVITETDLKTSRMAPVQPGL